ncbi:MAG: hypothetical protein BRD49_03645 [Bacteroidetes bacterium SW_10_40_5]|nr:MAG: hypothetical protein BRD49_03645 [Bacteroidetes bacterium SW_10_40_5]
MGWSSSPGGCIKTGKFGDFSVLKVFGSKFKELKVSYKAKKLDSSFSVSKTFDIPPIQRGLFFGYFVLVNQKKVTSHH